MQYTSSYLFIVFYSILDVLVGLLPDFVRFLDLFLYLIRIWSLVLVSPHIMSYQCNVQLFGVSIHSFSPSLPKTYDFPLGIRLTQFFVTYSIPILVLNFGHENFQSLKCLIFPQFTFSLSLLELWMFDLPFSAYLFTMDLFN